MSEISNKGVTIYPGSLHNQKEFYRAVETVYYDNNRTLPPEWLHELIERVKRLV